MMRRDNQSAWERVNDQPGVALGHNWEWAQLIIEAGCFLGSNGGATLRFLIDTGATGNLLKPWVPDEKKFARLNSQWFTIQLMAKGCRVGIT